MAIRKLSVVLDLDTAQWNGKLAGARGDVLNFGGVIKSTSSETDRFAGSMGNVGRSLQSPTARLRDLMVILGQARSAFLTLKDVSVGWLGGIVKQAGEVERLTVLMKGLSSATSEVGKNADAQKSLNSLYQIARTSGFAVQELADSFVKIKSGGIDPMNGSLRGLVDATAAFGGNSETLNRAAIAIQQMAGKGVVSMEELRQQLGEAVPSAITLMARAMGKTVPELSKMISTGTVQAKPALAAMFAEMERVYKGSGEKLANTLFGQMAQVKSNWAQLTTDFTGMGQEDSFFASIVQDLKELNTVMRSTDARAFVASLGAGVGNVASLFVSVVKTVIQFRDQVGFAFQALAIMWGMKTGLAWFNSLKAGAASVVESLGKMRGAFTAQNATIVQSIETEVMRARAVAETAFAEEQAAAVTARRALGEQTAAAAKLAAMQAEQEAASSLLASLETQQVARRGLVASMEAEQLAALNSIQTGRNAQGQFVSQQVALDNYTRSTERLRIAQSMLATTDNQVAVAQAEVARAEANAAVATDALFTATERATAAVAAQTVATEAATVAIAQEEAAIVTETAAKGVWVLATEAATVATAALSTAVSVALGPIGIIAMLAYQAARAFGVFEGSADRAAAAADRMRQGFQKAGDEASVSAQKAEIAAEKLRRANDPTARIGVALSGPTRLVDNMMGVQHGVRSMSDAELDKSLASLNSASAKGQENEYKRRRGEWYQYVVDGHDKFVVNLTQSYNRHLKAIDDQHLSVEAKLKAQEDLRKRYDAKKAGDMTSRMADLQARIDARTKKGLSSDPLKAAYAQLFQQSQATDGAVDAVAKTVGGKNFASQFANGAGQVAKMRAELNGSAGNLASFNAQLAAGSPKFKGWTDAQIAAVRGQMAMKDALAAAKGGANKADDLDKALQSTAGKIAQLKDELDGGQGTLAKFNAEVLAGAYKGVPEAKINQMREYLKLVESLQGKKDVNTATAKLDTELSKSRTEADALWKSFKDGTTESDKRLAQITSRFAGITDDLKGPDLDKANATIAQIVQNLKDADAADISYGWIESAKQISSSLLTENEQREQNYQLERARQLKLIALTVEGGERRKKMEAAFAQWDLASKAQLARQNESATTKMARNWANLGQNIQQSVSTAIGSYVDGLFEADFNTGKFVVSMIKSLLKIILQAMIAYAILSAIGMANNSSGEHVSMGSFLKGQIGSGFGLNTGNATSIGNPAKVTAPTAHTGGVIGGSLRSVSGVDASVWAAAKKYHTGGTIGDRPLMPGEVPIIAKEKELMLTEDQQGILAGKLKGGAGQAPSVKIEFINNSGTDMNAEAGEPKFNGADWVIGIVVDAASKQGTLRTALQSIGGKK